MSDRLSLRLLSDMASLFLEVDLYRLVFLCRPGWFYCSLYLYLACRFAIILSASRERLPLLLFEFLVDLLIMLDLRGPPDAAVFLLMI